jgi:hypothetical protein
VLLLNISTLVFTTNACAGANRLAAAKALSNRMGLSELSREVIGFDIVDLPLLGEDGLESNPIEPVSPKSPSKTKHHRRQSSLGHQPQGRHAIMYQQAQRVRELEQLIIVFDALGKFGLAWLDHDVYVLPTFVHIY